MGIKINYRANEICMLQFKNSTIHRDTNGNYYYDGTPNLETDPGIVVDFDIEHSYELFEALGNYWGGWNDTPSWQVMYEVAKAWDEKYGVIISDIDHDSIGFKLSKDLSETEIAKLLNEVMDLQGAMPCYDGGYDQMKEDIIANNRFEIWWD